MSYKIYEINEDLLDVMPQEIRDLQFRATWSNPKRGVMDLPYSKELIEEHSLCAGCPESMALRYILASLPAPEDTIIINSTGCTSLVFPHIALHTVHSLFGNQNAVASGIKRVLEWRFPDKVKDVVVLAGDGATVDIGLDCTLQSFFRQEKITTICFDNEVYANTGGQESGLTVKGHVFKMAPKGKQWEKVPFWQIAIDSGCHYVARLTVSSPKRVETVIKKAIYVAREVGPTYVHLYTPCILEIGLNSDDGLDEMRQRDKERFAFFEYVSEPAKEVIERKKEEGLL
ncbi:MAG: thiamine pyrophosphate-dependent enzyme [Aquificaceae bacterium]|nr:thiamine pyrophosphate-dependent enzyme [Aquificaceae bacterium]MCS7195994.1 thiamine pyrophosphate-dependent enzyme [Aquificaceae bacterium]MDW8032970.1 thiamine pyrophosphate-dependent enzyme [Aquificaceae bacterium]MDW8294282.1 thiamine pyrophosphate-dependent enzyme [Aquificaceae bacterium]